MVGIISWGLQDACVYFMQHGIAKAWHFYTEMKVNWANRVVGCKQAFCHFPYTISFGGSHHSHLPAQKTAEAFHSVVVSGSSKSAATRRSKFPATRIPPPPPTPHKLPCGLPRVCQPHPRCIQWTLLVGLHRRCTSQCKPPPSPRWAGGTRPACPVSSPGACAPPSTICASPELLAW